MNKYWFEPRSSDVSPIWVWGCKIHGR